MKELQNTIEDLKCKTEKIQILRDKLTKLKIKLKKQNTESDFRWRKKRQSDKMKDIWTAENTRQENRRILPIKWLKQSNVGHNIKLIN